ncbi:MAG: hypothetical protein Q9161_001454 [Pseudevernia consocians]
MHTATLLLSLFSINLALSLPAPDPNSIEAYHIKNKRQTAGWCTFHYTQTKAAWDSTLYVYGPPVDGGSPPYLSNYIPYANGVYSILPGYGDFLVATNDASNNVTFRRHGTVSGDTWTILETDVGDNIADHICSVGVWAYGTTRTMDCGFQCTPYTGPYATST